MIRSDRIAEQKPARKKFEDYEIGQVFNFESATISKSDITEFAHEWDPQLIHIDEAEATAVHGSLIASGYQTLLVTMRPVMAELMAKTDVIGAAGINELKWLIPVRPGDKLTMTARVTDLKPSRSKPDRGIVMFNFTANNQKGETVMTLEVPAMMQRRSKNV